MPDGTATLGTTPEALAIARHMAPSPYADAVAAMFLSGVPAETTAGFFRIKLSELTALVRWVCETNARRYVGPNA